MSPKETEPGRSQTPYQAKYRKGPTKAPEVFPTGLPCLNCGKPAMGDEYCSRKCLNEHMGELDETKRGRKPNV